MLRDRQQEFFSKFSRKMCETLFSQMTLEHQPFVEFVDGLIQIPGIPSAYLSKRTE